MKGMVENIVSGVVSGLSRRITELVVVIFHYKEMYTLNFLSV